MQVKVFMVVGDEASKLNTFEVPAKRIAHARRQARAELEKTYKVRAISVLQEGGLIAYVQDQPPPPKEKERLRPVRQEGLVGRGRQIRKARR